MKAPGEKAHGLRRESLPGGQEESPPLLVGNTVSGMGVRASALSHDLFELCITTTWRVNIGPRLSSERSRAEP